LLDDFVVCEEMPTFSYMRIVLHTYSIFLTMSNVRKEKKFFLINEEIQKGSGAKSYMKEGFLIFEDLAIYEEAVTHI
jgi:hypothetical protein